MNQDEPNAELNAKLYALMNLAEGMENGRAKVTLLEEAVRVADAHNDLDLAYEVRQYLIDAAIFGGASDIAIVAFSWCLAQNDKHPDRFNQHQLLWKYKWVVSDSPDHPQVPRKSIESMLEDMERRFREYGAGLFAVLQTKRQVMMSFGDIQGAREAMDGLSREKEGPLKDCPACDLNDQVKFYFLINDPKEALRRASPILADKMKCATVPQTTLAKVLLPLVFEGRLDDAVEYHRKGYSMIGTNPDFLSDAADHIRFLTVTDNLSQAIKALERHLPNAFAARELFARLHFYESAMFLMERCAEQDPSVKLRVPNEFPLQSDQGKFDAATLARWFYDQAAEIAAQFDARNGNTYRMSELEGVRKLHRKVTPHSIGK